MTITDMLGNLRGVLFVYTVRNVAWGGLKHLATGYLLYSLVQRLRKQSLTVGPTVIALIGSMAPDFIDKPLTWVGILHYGRSFAHSLFTTAFILTIVLELSRRMDRSNLGVAFSIGYLSHILVDMFDEVFGSLPYVDTAFLFWPVVVKHPIGIDRPLLPVQNAEIFIGVCICAFMLWIFDGMVGVSDLMRFLRDRLQDE